MSAGDPGPSRHRIAQSHLPINLKVALAKAEYTYFDQVIVFSADDLVVELNLPPAQVDEILKYASDPRADPASLTPELRLTQGLSTQHANLSTPASTLLSSRPTCRFSTFCGPIDALIGRVANHALDSAPASRPGSNGMIVPGMNVELSGPPGSGKTAMAIALALGARLGRWRSVNNEGYEEEDEHIGQVLLIDTEGGIPPDRLKRAAESLTRDTNESPMRALRGIHLLRISTQTQMIALLQILDDWLARHPQVNLIIFDTLSFHFRQPSLDLRARSRIMELAKLQIGKATSAHRCAVVITNQLATKLLTAENKPANFDTGDRAVLMPQLGDAWTTANTVRVVLFRGRKGDEMRYAHASSVGSNIEVPWMRYDIDNDGLPSDPVSDAFVF